LPEQPCPKCGYTLDAATPFGHNRAPGPQSVSMCFNCSLVLQWNVETRRWVWPTPEWTARALRETPLLQTLVIRNALDRLTDPLPSQGGPPKRPFPFRV
jgi:hypothetical protein